MMYCTADQVEALMQPARLGDGLMPTRQEVEDMIGRKSELIDGYCRDRYDVPFATVPIIVEDICLALCLADLVPLVFNKNELRIKDAAAKAAWAQRQLDRIQQHALSLQDEDEASQGMGAQVLASEPETDPKHTIEQVW
jgi:phage gp36-like protein